MTRSNATTVAPSTQMNPDAAKVRPTIDAFEALIKARDEAIESGMFTLINDVKADAFKSFDSKRKGRTALNTDNAAQFVSILRPLADALPKATAEVLAEVLAQATAYFAAEQAFLASLDNPAAVQTIVGAVNGSPIDARALARAIAMTAPTAKGTLALIQPPK